jgi:hypothetical protein
MFPTLLAAALAARIAIPAFTTDHAPGILSSRLPNAYAAALDSAHCANPVPVARFGPQTAQALIDCEGNLVCIADVAKLMGVQAVLLGSVTKLDDAYTTKLKLLDVHEHAVKQTFEAHFTGPLKAFDGSLAQLIPEVCRALDPSWVDPARTAAEQKLAEIEFDSGEAKPVKPAPAGTDFDLPVLPPEEAVAKPPPVALNVARPPVVAKPAPVAAVAPPTPAPPTLPPVAIATKPVAVAAAPALDMSVKPREATPAPASPQVLGFLPAPRSSQARLGAYVSLGAAGVATVIGSVFGGSALSALSQRNAASSETAFYSAQSSLGSRGTGANVAFGVAGAALVTSAVLWFAGDRIFHDHP